jgi:hypothetical protein
MNTSATHPPRRHVRHAKNKVFPEFPFVADFCFSVAAVAAWRVYLFFYSKYLYPKKYLIKPIYIPKK